MDRENDAFWKQRRHQNRHGRVPDHSTVSIQNGGQRYNVVVWTGKNDTKMISADANLFETD